ncbi:AAA family ATPase [Blastopirellula marina]|uniref:DNA helicase DnaB-like N-terminal domain-containing protein n=1 Tax=Blastopirellula marina DSM 3645 TaxID=314230 RepID=A3ZY10_9BACT|nr:AAA family ATPase [Blastopirellula marina]EAQ78721.1 hypothetical protein DSM3645_08010 [Blastopirellula marina DSM 3645]
MHQLVAQLKSTYGLPKNDAPRCNLTPVDMAEAQWLGCVLLFPERLADDPLSVDDFKLRQHRDLYSVFLQLQTNGHQCSDLPRLFKELQALGYGLKQAVVLVKGVMDRGGEIAHLDQYAAIIREPQEESQAVAVNPGEEEIVRVDLTGGSPFQEFTTAQLLEEEQPLKWLLPNMLAQNEPAVIVGPSKSMKTSITVDLCAAFASGGKFLGQFAVQRAYRVGYVSSTLERKSLFDLARRWSDANGAASKPLDNLFWALSIDDSTDPANLPQLRDWISKHQLEVVVIDTLRLTSTGKRTQAAQLRDLVRCCMDAGATPILCCQSCKAIKSGTLEGTGVTDHLDFARQWMLVQRRQNYLPGSGQHRLRLTLGGNAGQGGEWGVDINEGRLEDPTGRRWNVTLRDVDSLVVETVACEAQALEQRLRAKIRVTIANIEETRATKSKIRDHSGVNGAKFAAAWDRLIASGEIEVSPTYDSKTQSYPTYRLSDRSSPPEKNEAVRSGPEAHRDVGSAVRTKGNA